MLQIINQIHNSRQSYINVWYQQTDLICKNKQCRQHLTKGDIIVSKEMNHYKKSFPRLCTKCKYLN